MLLSFLLSGSPEFTAFGQANWDDSKYSQYTWETFKNYGPANSEIDFKNIDYELLCAAIHYATNEQRVNFNLPPFGYSYYLKGAAMLHAYDMVKDNFFAHENPNDPAKKTPFDRMATILYNNRVQSRKYSLPVRSCLSSLAVTPISLPKEI